MRRHRKTAQSRGTLSGFLVARGDYLRVHFDDDGPFGSGRRGVVVVAIGRVWITLVSPVTLAMHKVTPRELRRGRPQRVALRPGETARLIRNRLALYRRLEIRHRYPEQAIRDALRRLA